MGCGPVMVVYNNNRQIILHSFIRYQTCLRPNMFLQIECLLVAAWAVCLQGARDWCMTALTYDCLSLILYKFNLILIYFRVC